MHTKQYKTLAIHHNGDYSGDIFITIDGQEIRLPFEDIKSFIADYVRDLRITSLEQADADEILEKW